MFGGPHAACSAVTVPAGFSTLSSGSVGSFLNTRSSRPRVAMPGVAIRHQKQWHSCSMAAAAMQAVQYQGPCNKGVLPHGTDTDKVPLTFQQLTLVSALYSACDSAYFFHTGALQLASGTRVQVCCYAYCRWGGPVCS